MIKQYEALVKAIVLQAVHDWRSAVRSLRTCPWYDRAREVREDCEGFFCSDWFTALTNLDGRMVLRRLKQEEGIHDE